MWIMCITLWIISTFCGRNVDNFELFSIEEWMEGNSLAYELNCLQYRKGGGKERHGQ